MLSFPASRLALSLVVASALVSGPGCSSKSATPQPPPPPPTPRAEASNGGGPAPSTVDTSEADSLRRSLGESEVENRNLREELAMRNSALTALEEENVSLELELAIALEELLRTQANLKNVQSRAFAVSRIAEVRVELEALRGRNDPAFLDRLDRADNFLKRADQALVEDNVGGAAFLAERAGELVRQSKTIAEVRSRESKELLPIVPSREIEVRAAANLRNGPGPNARRVGGVAAGTKLDAVARLGDWFQVKTETGETAWIHRGLVH